MAERLKGLGIDGKCIQIIPNWADGTLIVPIEPKQNALRASWVR